MSGRVATAAPERFAEKCRLVESGCIEWQGAQTHNGYGLFHCGPGKRMHIAHRWLRELVYGPAPADLDVMHSCDNRLCVNVDHLTPGTRKQNMEDAVARGRTSHVPRNVGDKHPMRKLCRADVDVIRATYPGSTLKVLAERFGVTTTTIHRVVTHANWKD